MSKIKSLLKGQRPPGVYRLTSRVAPGTLRRSVEQAGWRFFYLDGRQIKDKASFLSVSATAIEFPAYFGHNWDAFEESVGDLEWAPASGYVVLYDHVDQFAHNHPDDWTTALSILENAVTTWQKAGTPMYVLLRGDRLPIPEV